MEDEAPGKTHMENRDFWKRKVVPILRNKTFKLLRKNLVYEYGNKGKENQEALDEIMLCVYKNPKKWTNKGWVGLDPWNVRQADMDDGRRVVKTLHAIGEGMIPLAAIQNLMSVPHQVRIRFGASPMPPQLISKGRHSSAEAVGATKTMDKLFDRNSKVENAIRKYYKNHRADAQPGDVEAAVAKELAELENRPEGLIDKYGNPITPKQD